jgi:hypothetical protein
MVKSYLRYEQARAFGVVASPDACPIYDGTGKARHKLRKTFPLRHRRRRAANALLPLTWLAPHSHPVLGTGTLYSTVESRHEGW